MALISAIVAVIPLILRLIDLFQVSPEEKRQAVAKALAEYIEEILAGAKKARENPGDTSDLERAINRRRI